ncbi:MAG TPA: winged helix DNA-binding domain-containing protein [Actinomycetes bacterium]|nr:winged helix DNA-binding domain-containing protein [Actinomycetes bacterium]
MNVSRSDVLGLRVRAQQLDRDGGGTVADTALLDIGAQDTGPDGALWALAVRGLTDVDAKDLVWLWTLRGAPHAYRRSDVGSVAAAVAPWSDADAAKRIFDASKPLKAAGIGTVDALDTVAAEMRRIVTRPTVKGEVSTRLTALLPEPYLRWCNPCQATHPHELPFRLAAVRAGLELQQGTSPPVLQRVRGFRAAGQADARHELVRIYLRLFGPSTPQLVAGFLDAPVTDVKARWPDDVVEVDLDGQRRWVLADEVDLLEAPPSTTRLLGPYDLYLQGKDRPLLVNDPARAKALWPVIGRPGVVLVDGEVAGSWRPRTRGGRLRLEVVLWSARRTARAGVADQAERLAAHRGVGLAGVDVS